MTKLQLIAYLTIGNLLAALLWNFPVNAWNWDDVAEELTNNINAIAAGESQAQAPLDVPQMQAPIGNSASIQPCAAPPPIPVASTEEMPTGLGRRHNPANSNLKDPRAKILMGIAPGNRMRSLLNRVSYPDRVDSNNQVDIYQTLDGEIAVKRNSDDRVVSIGFIQ